MTNKLIPAVLLMIGISTINSDCWSIDNPQLIYHQPAKKWDSEALPIGNGRMGAMLFGGVAEEHIQFNEQSLWSGDNNWDGAYECGDHGFGAYRNFGDLTITWNGGAPVVDSPSGHAAGNGQPIAATIDGDPKTKWCIEEPGDQVIWQAALPSPQAIKWYSLTSANDVPRRDPQVWLLEGSLDGKKWFPLDRQELDKPFEQRFQARRFEIADPQPCRYYRLSFTPMDKDHFQLAEVSLGDLSLADTPTPKDYQRSLNLITGIHTTTFKHNNIEYQREAFASHPDQVLVFRTTADKPKALSGTIRLKSAQGASTIATGQELSFSGEMPNQLKYACKLHVLYQGGTVQAQDDQLVFANCDSLTLLINARTNYKPDYNAGWRGVDPAPVIETELAAASRKPFEVLRTAHIKDLSRLLDSVTIDIGQTDPAITALATDERLKRYADGEIDPDLEEIMFQYGRYLLASCSRPGGLPANLQGLWNNSNTPPWASDYHNNINVQMNYWGAESTGLSECHLPLIDFVVAAAEPCRIATRKAFGENTRGWTARTSQSIFGGNGWQWNIPASAWYAQHAYEHWAFTRDNDYLKKTAYPMLKEICQMWEDRLKPLPDGALVVPMGWSPEHGPREDGVMHDQQLIWDLFQNYLDAARALEVDEDYQQKVAQLQAKLAPNKIGKWGQLQEWQADRDDPDDQHRHTSHLFAVYPGRQISLTQTPDLAYAAIVSLRSRSGNYGTNKDKPFTVESTIGDSRRSWTWPWRCALWARLGEGERAGIMVRGLLTYNTLSNLFCTHPPFQMDGNFGITGAIPEMLLQSHAGEINLLPALPQSWARQGFFRGLKARGGYTVNCTWKDGKVTQYEIASPQGGEVTARINGQVKKVKVVKK